MTPPLFYLCFAVVGLALLWAILYSFRFASRAWWRNRDVAGPRRQTMHFLAILLCEPLVTLLVIVAVFRLGRLDLFQQFSMVSNIASIMLITTPMVMLLAPAFGLRVSDSFYRSLNTRIFAIGLTRWLLSIAIVLLITMEWPISSMLCMLIACVFLFVSLFWGIDIFNNLLSIASEHEHAA